MSKVTDVKHNLRAIWAYRLSQRGRTPIEIHEATGIPLSKVANRVLLGERLSTLEEYKCIMLHIEYLREK